MRHFMRGNERLGVQTEFDSNVRSGLSTEARKPKEEVVRFRSCMIPLFSLLLFSLPDANAQDVSKGRDVFITRCLRCHAFACNKEGPRLGGLIGRKARVRIGANSSSLSLLPDGYVDHPSGVQRTKLRDSQLVCSVPLSDSCRSPTTSAKSYIATLVKL